MSLEGKGTLSLEDWVLTGTFKNSRLHGEGQRRSQNGEVFKGLWVCGKLTGKGTHSSDRESYEGHFKDNLESG
jgi:hypothetical protein